MALFMLNRTLANPGKKKGVETNLLKRMPKVIVALANWKSGYASESNYAILQKISA